ncbi:MAG: ComEC/Rec2 family competence protein [Terrimicrobiaceae bacterium]
MTDRAFPWQQRLPFVGLFFSSVAGILLGSFAPLDATLCLAGFGVSLLVWVVHRRVVWIYLATGFAFAALHLWQSRESPAQWLAEQMEGGPTVASLRGRIIGHPDGKPGAKSRLLVELEELNLRGQTIHPACRVLVLAPVEAPLWNDEISASGTLRRIAAPRNPGQFDARAHLSRLGATCELVVSSPSDIRIEPDTGFSIPRLASTCRRWMEATLREGISGDPLVCELLAGLVLGATSEIPETLQDQFRQTGTYHIFSVSGLHVGMIAVILWQLLRAFAVDRRACVLVIIPAIFFYALVTGWKPSSIRAATMTAIFLIGMISSRQPVPLNSLCAAAFLILAQSTNELFNPGFQLSVTVVAAILLLSTPIQTRLRAALLPDPFIPTELWTPPQKARCRFAGATSGLVAVSIAAWLGSLPLTLWYFQIISLSALVANPVIVPLTFVIMSTALLALGGGVFSPFLAAVFNNANLALTKILLVFIPAIAALPGSFFTLGIPPRAPLEVVVFDLGSGGATAFRSEGRLALVDCGSVWNFEKIIRPWLRGTGKLSPDLLVITHGDAEHLGAAASIAEASPQTRFIDSPLQDRSPTRQRVQEKAINRSIHQAGDAIRLSENATLRILHPPASLIADKADDKAIIVLLESPFVRILLLSDSGPSAWETMEPVRADLAVMGRHHSGILPDAGFFEKNGVRAVIASAAEFPDHEPIDENWAAMLREHGIALFRMDESGAVQILAGPKGIEAEGFVNGQKYSPPN